jgi:hypothetical protein
MLAKQSLIPTTRSCIHLQGWKVFAGVRKQEDGQQLQLQHTGKGGSIVPVVREDGAALCRLSVNGSAILCLQKLLPAANKLMAALVCDPHKCIYRSLM